MGTCGCLSAQCLRKSPVVWSRANICPDSSQLPNQGAGRGLGLHSPPTGFLCASPGSDVTAFGSPAECGWVVHFPSELCLLGDAEKAPELPAQGCVCGPAWSLPSLPPPSHPSVKLLSHVFVYVSKEQLPLTLALRLV